MKAWRSALAGSQRDGHGTLLLYICGQEWLSKSSVPPCASPAALPQYCLVGGSSAACPACIAGLPAFQSSLVLQLSATPEGSADHRVSIQWLGMHRSHGLVASKTGIANLPAFQVPFANLGWMTLDMREVAVPSSTTVPARKGLPHHEWSNAEVLVG